MTYRKDASGAGGELVSAESNGDESKALAIARPTLPEISPDTPEAPATPSPLDEIVDTPQETSVVSQVYIFVVCLH